MKRLFFIIPILLCIALANCKKASGPADGNSVQQNNNLDSTAFMSASISGKSWTADSAYGYYVQNSANDSGSVSLMITASQNLNDTISTITFNINNYTGPNSYPINPPINTATYYIGSMRNFGLSGVINITSDTAHALKGNFQFTADTFAITNGNFNVALP